MESADFLWFFNDFQWSEELQKLKKLKKLKKFKKLKELKELKPTRAPATGTARPGHLSSSQPQPVAGPTKAPATGRAGLGQPGPSLIWLDFEWFSYDFQRIVNIFIDFYSFPMIFDMIDNDL